MYMIQRSNHDDMMTIMMICNDTMRAMMKIQQFSVRSVKDIIIVTIIIIVVIINIVIIITMILIIITQCSVWLAESLSSKVKATAASKWNLCVVIIVIVIVMRIIIIITIWTNVINATMMMMTLKQQKKL